MFYVVILLMKYKFCFSGMQYEMDKESEKHVILCRVVLGNVERVDLECHQSRCSRVEYDTGSNDPNNPNWYVVWANDINKRILPVYVVTCKTSAIMNGKFITFITPLSSYFIFVI